MIDTENTELRLYCVMRADLGEIPIGKLMAQAGHAFVSTLRQADEEIRENYFTNAQPKIVLKGKNQHVIERAAQECILAGIPHYVVVDVGRTVFAEPTMTCIGIGPVCKNDLPVYIKKLQLFV